MMDWQAGANASRYNRMWPGDTNLDWQAEAAAITASLPEGTLTSSGGWCAPIAPMYDPFSWAGASAWAERRDRERAELAEWAGDLVERAQLLAKIARGLDVPAEILASPAGVHHWSYVPPLSPVLP